MLRRCPNCNSTRLNKNKNLIKCKKCGYFNNQYDNKEKKGMFVNFP